MSISMYEATVPVLLRFLGNLEKWLDKAQAHADQKKFDTGVLVRSRLAPDMVDLARQVQIASDNAKGCVARLTGAEAPKYEDNEATFAELKERIAKTVAYVTSFKPAQFEGSETRDIVLKFPSATLEFKGKDYVLHFVIPNFLFHMTTAYNILRHNGVEIGKTDYLAR
ncbi:MAG: DUF1993 domain-containing protein [Pseudomonadota bacterium]|nr:DUF1993 domain-containing protein [Pseudomonadota bacterium]